MDATVYVVGNPCKPLIAWDLIGGLGLSIHGRGYTTGLGPTVQTPSLGTQHLSSVSQSKYPMETAPTHMVVMRGQPGETLSRSISVPGSYFNQPVHKARTEWVDEEKRHICLTVDANMHGDLSAVTQ